MWQLQRAAGVLGGVALVGSALVTGLLAQGPSVVTALWLLMDSGHPTACWAPRGDDAEFLGSL